MVQKEKVRGKQKSGVKKRKNLGGQSSVRSRESDISFSLAAARHKMHRDSGTEPRDIGLKLEV